MNLPESISAYLAAANSFDADAAAAHFAVDAHVHDENHDHVGREAVRAWIEDTSRKFRPQTEVMSADVRGEEVLVTNRVSGDFPGSPAELKFVFTLRDGQIARLNIG